MAHKDRMSQVTVKDPATPSVQEWKVASSFLANFLNKADDNKLLITQIVKILNMKITAFCASDILFWWAMLKYNFIVVNPHRNIVSHDHVRCDNILRKPFNIYIWFTF